jgi:2-polyprenyl-3-methyl-5-hydroxy-6-metoxy-1,4-benzoquinol methylase
MTFPLSHWKNPRQTIATRFQHNDIAYATHGAVLACEALRVIDKPASELKKLKMLDYGCGTGRVARVLCGLFGEVYAYDPVKECIDMARTECTGMNFHNIHYFHEIDKVPIADMSICINVIEHLTDIDAQVLVDNLKNKVTGPSYLWYSSTKNKVFMDKYLNQEQILQDDASGGIVIRELFFSKH